MFMDINSGHPPNDVEHPLSWGRSKSSVDGAVRKAIKEIAYKHVGRDANDSSEFIDSMLEDIYFEVVKYGDARLKFFQDNLLKADNRKEEAYQTEINALRLEYDLTKLKLDTATRKLSDTHKDSVIKEMEKKISKLQNSNSSIKRVVKDLLDDL